MRWFWQVFHDRSLRLRTFWCFVPLILEYCSAVLWSADNSPLKQLGRIFRSAVFLTRGVLGCNLADRRSVTLLSVPFKIKSNAMPHFTETCHLCSMCWRVFLLMLWLLKGTSFILLAVELLSTAGPLCPSQYLSGTILMTMCLMVWDWRVFRAESMSSCWFNLLFLLSPPIFCFSFSSFSVLVVWG